MILIPPLMPEHERVIACTGCGAHIAIGPHHQHLDPATFRGAACGCRQPATTSVRQEAA